MRIIKNDVPYEIIDVSRTTRVKFYTSVDTGSYVPNHWHSAVEIIYLLEGNLLVTIESKDIFLQEGQCVLININAIHATRCTEKNKAIVLQMPAEFIELYLPEIKQLMFILDDGKDDEGQNVKVMKKLLLQMKQAADSQAEGFLLQFNSLLFELLYYLYEKFSVKISRSDNRQKKKDLDRLNGVLKYITQNYTRNISLDEIAAVAMFNPRSFCRFFKKHMGITFLQYQNELRLAHIYRDLLDTKDPLYEILERHGFFNYKLFRRMFWQYFGSTPMKLRRKLKKIEV